MPPIQGHIRFEQVTFRYPESNTNTLENISFEIQPRQTVALVGLSGSGKTTISRLLLGLYPPTIGKISIDGYDISSPAFRSLRPQIGVVEQNIFLFRGTIRDNITVGRPQATRDAVIKAATQAGAHQFIKELPMGYETQIGEGEMLSGGQRYCLAIARALIEDPRLLILDEPTSSFDAESERIIQTNFNEILTGRTTLVIARRRLSTVHNADLILVLDRGILVESGTHDELMTNRGHYFYLN